MISPIRNEREHDNNYNSPMSAVPYVHRRVDICSTPCLNSTININFSNERHSMHNKKNCIRDDNFNDTLGLPAKDKNIWTTMYIDDLSVGEVLDLDTAVSTFSQSIQKREVHARKSEESFKNIMENATSIGMKINSEKTQLLCINDCNYSETNSFIYTDDDTKINSTCTMKTLGFIFSNRPNVVENTNYIIKKCNRSVWSLNHLKRAGISQPILLKVYCTMLRPVIEFCSAVYHSLLTEQQSDNLERLQKSALRIIYGFGKEYSEIIELAGIPTLKARRIIAFENFARNISRNERYNWFPLDEGERSTRQKKKYKEMFARTDRLYKSPLYSKRRFLNSENITEVKDD